MRIDSSPVYLDTSALAKIYLAEPESEDLEEALLGRRDLLVSDLAVTELTSALARRQREGDIAPRDVLKVYRRLVRDVAQGEFRRADLDPGTHREAERLLLGIGSRVALRAADALHLAIALRAEARVFLTFDRRLKEAAETAGVFELPV